MNQKFYEQHTEKFFIGKMVETLTPLKNGWCEIAAGTKAVITRKYNGFSLLTEPCPECDVRILISRVSPYEVRLLDTYKKKGFVK